MACFLVPTTEAMAVLVTAVWAGIVAVTNRAAKRPLELQGEMK